MPLSQLVKSTQVNPIYIANSLNFTFKKCLFTTDCWSCKRKLNEAESKEVICPCPNKVILPVNHNENYFDIFKLPVTFELDQPSLTRTFRNIMRVLHPDMHTYKSEVEKEHSVNQSSFVNNAYKTLSNDLERAFYILKLQGFHQNEETQMDQDFLMDVLEMNEKLAEISTAKEVHSFSDEINKHLVSIRESMAKEFQNNNYKQAFSLANKMRYYVNLNETVRELKLKFKIQE